MPMQVRLGNIAVRVVLKDIKNVHLSVHPPTGWVTISPGRMRPHSISVSCLLASYFQLLTAR